MLITRPDTRSLKLRSQLPRNPFPTHHQVLEAVQPVRFRFSAQHRYSRSSARNGMPDQEAGWGDLRVGSRPANEPWPAVSTPAAGCAITVSTPKSTRWGGDLITRCLQPLTHRSQLLYSEQTLV
jgi:hypothetical protein